MPSRGIVPRIISVFVPLEADRISVVCHPLHGLFRTLHNALRSESMVKCPQSRMIYVDTTLTYSYEYVDRGGWVVLGDVCHVCCVLSDEKSPGMKMTDLNMNVCASEYRYSPEFSGYWVRYRPYASTVAYSGHTDRTPEHKQVRVLEYVPIP